MMMYICDDNKVFYDFITSLIDNDDDFKCPNDDNCIDCKECLK